MLSILWGIRNGRHDVHWHLLDSLDHFGCLPLGEALIQTSKTNTASTEETALDILKKELAKGNITEEEFEKKKKLL